MRRESIIRKTVVVAFILFVLLYLLPYFWLILTSLKSRLDAFALPPKLIFTPTLESYRTVFFEKGFTGNLLNSLLVTSAVTSISLLLGIPSAYAFSRFSMRGEKALFFYLLGTRFTPVIVLALPLYFIMNDLRLLDSFLGIILAHTAFNVAFVVWMMKGFFDTTPRAVDESARVDGASWLTILIRINIPLASHGIAATAVFCAINSWNEFLTALILTGHRTATLPVALPELLTPQGTFWGQIAAVGTVITVPVLLFAFLVQRYMVQGLSTGAVK